MPVISDADGPATRPHLKSYLLFEHNNKSLYDMDNYDLDTPLMELVSNSGRGIYTARMSIEGIFITGANGSGKSSASGYLLSCKMLSAGWGGLIMTVKPEEAQIWKDRCRLTGRECDLIIVEPGGHHFFNFLEYESSKKAGGSSLTDNIVDVLKTVIHASQEQSTGKSDDRFWESALDSLMASVIDMVKLAYGHVTIKRLYDIVQTIPKNLDELYAQNTTAKPKAFVKAFNAARSYVTSQIEAWTLTIPEEEHERLSDEVAYETELEDAIPDARLLKHLDQFFVDNFIPLSEKTRSVIDVSFSAFLAPLVREPVYSLFCRHPSTFTPEDSLQGKIILINLPVKDYHKVGRDVQILVKYLWQRAMEKRNVAENGRPVFLWADEAQTFIHPKDTDFQATARSSRVATVYLSQNLSNLHGSMGGDRSEHKVKSFLGTMGTKIFHANSDRDTNVYASELIGDNYVVDESESITIAQNYSQTRGRSLKLERVVRPEQFISLRTGGPLNNFRVEGYLHRQGDSLMNGHNHIKMNFNQLYQPQ